MRTSALKPVLAHSLHRRGSVPVTITFSQTTHTRQFTSAVVDDHVPLWVVTKDFDGFILFNCTVSALLTNLHCHLVYPGVLF